MQKRKGYVRDSIREIVPGLYVHVKDDRVVVMNRNNQTVKSEETYVTGEEAYLTWRETAVLHQAEEKDDGDDGV